MKFKFLCLLKKVVLSIAKLAYYLQIKYINGEKFCHSFLWINLKARFYKGWSHLLTAKKIYQQVCL